MSFIQELRWATTGVKHTGVKRIPPKLHLQHLFQTEGRCVSTGKEKVTAQIAGICTCLCALTLQNEASAATLLQPRGSVRMVKRNSQFLVDSALWKKHQGVCFSLERDGRLTQNGRKIPTPDSGNKESGLCSSQRGPGSPMPT